MRSLKALVIFMGVLIVIGLALLAYGLTTKAGRLAMGTPATGFGEVEASLPKGAVIAETSVGDGRVVLRVEMPGGEQRLMVFDLSTGASLGVIRLERGGGKQ
jgi:hypothetical protein